jgi:hypothetical protein
MILWRLASHLSSGITRGKEQGNRESRVIYRAFWPMHVVSRCTRGYTSVLSIVGCIQLAAEVRQERWKINRAKLQDQFINPQ